MCTHKNLLFEDLPKEVLTPKKGGPFSDGSSNWHKEIRRRELLFTVIPFKQGLICSAKRKVISKYPQAKRRRQADE